MSDIFDDEDADETTLMTQNWARMKEDRTKGGYREGVSEGREARLQEGFNKGFQENLELYQSLGYMSGVLRGLIALIESQDIPEISESSRTAVMSLIERVDRLKKANPTEPTLHGDSSSISRSKGSAEHKSLDVPAAEDISCKDVGTADVINQVRTDFKKLLEDINLTDIAM